MKAMKVLPYTSASFTCRLQTHTPQKANVPSLRQQCPPHIHSSRRRLGVSRLIGLVESRGPLVERWMLPGRPRPPPVLRFLHCGRCPWLWNDEHVLVMSAVVGIGFLF